MLCSILSSSDDFSVATPDETAGKDTEFSLVVSLRNKDTYIYQDPLSRQKNDYLIWLNLIKSFEAHL